jgi:hypothetical protein
VKETAVFGVEVEGLAPSETANSVPFTIMTRIPVAVLPRESVTVHLTWGFPDSE